MTESSSDILSSSLLSTSEASENSSPNQEFNKLIPAKADVSQYFEKIGQVKGVEYAQCKSCLEAHEKKELSRVMKIKTKPENMRKHLKNCKFFCAEHNLDAPAKQVRSKAGFSAKNDENHHEFHLPPSGCKMIHIKYSRRTETVDITEGTTGSMLVKDLKIVFGVDESAKCFLRRESDKKVILGSVDVLQLVETGEVFKLEFVR
ncbi:PB1 domain-containing protein [Entamoeba marina]